MQRVISILCVNLYIGPSRAYAMTFALEVMLSGPCLGGNARLLLS